jgi:hypothetical protein
MNDVGLAGLRLCINVVLESDGWNTFQHLDGITSRICSYSCVTPSLSHSLTHPMSDPMSPSRWRMPSRSMSSSRKEAAADSRAAPQSGM